MEGGHELCVVDLQEEVGPAPFLLHYNPEGGIHNKVSLGFRINHRAPFQHHNSFILYFCANLVHLELDVLEHDTDHIVLELLVE